ncbi:MAG TPA: nucleotide exchange factor GrpE [Verrucomicrobiae bacterium]|nr:nucleotide exchange factor GrpE [Verrucomicrobiae bacterium]
MSAKHKHTTNASPSAATENDPVASDSITLSLSELEQLKAAAAKADENWDKFLRTAADLENYRKRVAREKEELARYTAERVVAALLPVLDNLERALEAAKQQGNQTALIEGIQQVQNQFRRTLEEFGLEEVVAHTGHPFDPNIHEAVGHAPSAEHPEGQVLELLQRGYKLADRLLRPARVVVSKGPPDAGQSEAVEPESEPSE